MTLSELPPPPPPLPASRKIGNVLLRLWPFAAWCGALLAAVWLYFNEAGHGHTLALEEAQEVRVAPGLAGRLATLQVSLGQKVVQGDLIATLDARDLEARIRFAKAEIDRSKARLEAERQVLQLEPQDRKAQAAVRLLPFELELKSQEARAAELERERDQYRITAPIAGSVDQIAARAGEWRAAGAEVVQLVVPHPDRLTAYVSDRQIPAVTVGTRATLRPRDRGGPPREGTVVRVGPRVDQVPVRLRAISTQLQWGRSISIQVETPGDSLPGEIFDVRFHR